MRNNEEKAGLCALGRIFGFEPKTGTALINHKGSATEVFRTSKDELEALLGPYSRHKGLITQEALEKAAAELEYLENIGIRYCGCTEDDGYPSILKECEDPPIGLYIRSETPPEELWKPERKIAIVGTRDISPYGREWCEKIVMGLERSGVKPLIVSGLALGTDICAHRAALEAGLPTIGVMATGPENIYPCRNKATALLMTRTPGCALITDYPPGTAPLAVHFLRRNRIIAGLAEATILIESKLRGGGMMTSRLAFSYSRDVYALPGRIDDTRSQGCNELIRNKTAEALTSVNALLQGLGLPSATKIRNSSSQDILRQVYGDSARNDSISMMEGLLSAIRTHRGITVEELASLAQIPYHTAANLCSMMESDGIISTDLLQRCHINTKIV